MKKQLAIGALIIGLALTGCSAKTAGVTTDPAAAAAPAETSAPAADTGHSVVYSITSDASTSTSISYLTLNNGGVSQEQANGAALPWSTTVAIDADPSIFNYQSFTLVGQMGEGGTTITCDISIDGVSISTHTSTGQYAVVSCTGTPKS